MTFDHHFGAYTTGGDFLETLVQRFEDDGSNPSTAVASTIQISLLGIGIDQIHHYEGDLPNDVNNFSFITDKSISREVLYRDPRGLLVDKITEKYGDYDNDPNTAETAETTHVESSYDLFGQLEEVTSTIPGVVDPIVQTFEYDDNGNRIDGTETGDHNRLLSDESSLYVYDAEGNLTERWTHTSVVALGETDLGNSTLRTPEARTWGPGLYYVEFSDLEFVNHPLLSDPEEELGLSVTFVIDGNEQTIIFDAGTIELDVDNTIPYDLHGEAPGVYAFRVDSTITDAKLWARLRYVSEGNEEDAIVKAGATMVVTETIVDRFDWDHRNRLSKATRLKSINSSGTTTVLTIPGTQEQVTLKASTPSEYIYDVHNQLLSNGQQYFIHERGQIVSRGNIGSSGDVRLWVPGTDNLLADEDTYPAWALTDYQGSVKHVVRVGQFSVAEISYDAFGKPTFLTATWGINAFHAGREFDNIRDLYYNRARWYDPGAGRFISEDPIGFAGGDANLYRYGSNSYSNATDPSGHFAEWLLNFANNGEHIYGIIPTDSYVGGFYESVGTAVGNAAPEFFANANAWTLLGGTLALSAGIAVGGYAIGSVALPAGMLGLSGGSLGAIGSGAAFTQGLLQTYAANPNAGLGAYASAAGLGAVFGAFVPGAGIGGLAGSVGGGAIGSAFGDTSMGVQFGGLAGDLLGGGLAAGSRRAALTNLAYQGAGAGIGGLAGGLYYGNARGALFGANLGAFGGGIAQSGVGLYRSFKSTGQFSKLRGQVQALKEIGVSTREGRRAFFNGKQALFERYSSELGRIDGWVQRRGKKISSIIFSMRAQGPDGTLLPLRHLPVKNGTGAKLLSHHRAVSQRLGIAFGAKQLELGGTAILNESVEAFVHRLNLEQRSVYVDAFDEIIDYYGKDFNIR